MVGKALTAKNDLYGSLYFYLQHTLQQFCRQIGNLKASIQIFQVDALKLPSILGQHGMGHCSFDRIEVRLLKSVSFRSLDVPALLFTHVYFSRRISW